VPSFILQKREYQNYKNKTLGILKAIPEKPYTVAREWISTVLLFFLPEADVRVGLFPPVVETLIIFRKRFRKTA
jgi:hypothetical protein